MRLWHWIVGVCALGTASCLLLLLSPEVLPADDPMGMYREAVARGSRVFQGLLLLTGSVLFFDYVTPGDWLERIHESPMACAVVVAALLYVLGIGFVA